MGTIDHGYVRKMPVFGYLPDNLRLVGWAQSVLVQ